MAKKRRQKIEKKDDYVFTPPEMNKHQFIRDELRNAKAIFIAFGFGILVSLVSYGLLTITGDFRSGFIIGILAMGALPYLFNYFKLDTASFEKKNWAGSFAVYFFTWFMIIILLSNPPIVDNASPEIKEITIEIYETEIIENETVGRWIAPRNNSDGEPIVHLNETFRISVTIIDNGELDVNSLKVQFKSSTTTLDQTTRTKVGDNGYIFEVLLTPPTAQVGEYEYIISAVDDNGNVEEYHGVIAVASL